MEHHTYLGSVHGTYGAVSVALSRDQRFEHLGILGSSGVGKSVLLRAIAAADIARGDGLLFIDPHGDDAEALLDYVPPWRHNHVCYLNLADLSAPVAFNFLEDTLPDDRARTADALVSALRDIWFESWGPRMETILRQSALALLEMPRASIAFIPRLLTDDEWRAAVTSRLSNSLTRNFFEHRFDEWRDAYRGEAIEPVLNKLDAVLSFPALLETVGQHRSTLHLEHAMAAGRIVIANLTTGIVGGSAARVFGALLIARARTAAMSRARIAPHERRDFHIIIDEAQTMATNSLPLALAELRKFSVSVCFATQMLSGLSDQTRAALLGTTGSLAAFRMGEDAEVIAPKFNRLHQDFNANLLYELDRGEAIVKIGADDVHRVLVPPPGQGVKAGAIIPH